MRRVLPAVLTVLLAASYASADVVLALRYGHGGRTVAGAITPVGLRIENRESTPVTVRFDLRPDGSGDLTSTETWVGVGATKDLTLFLRPRAFARPRLTASFDRAVAVLVADHPPTAPSREFEIDVPDSDPAFGPGDIELLAVGPQARMLPPAPEGINVLALPEADLHEFPLAYDGLDTVYWRNPAEERPPSVEAVKALLRWVALGGRLVISATRRPETLAGTLLEGVLPATFGPPIPGQDYRSVARDLLGFRLVAGDGELPESGPLTPLVPRGRPSPESLPHACEARLGFGSIAVLAYDPARFAGAREQLAAAVWLSLLDHRHSDPKAFVSSLAGDFSDRAALPQGRDLPAEIITALLENTASPPPMAVISFFLVLYILAVGPFDYFFLRRLDLLRWSALSFIVLAILFSVVAFFVSVYLFSGPATVNRVTLVDIASDPAGEGADLVRIEDFASFYGPYSRTVEFDVPEPGAQVDRFIHPLEYAGTGASLPPAGPLTIRRNAALALDARLSVPFRAVRLARTVRVRTETVPLSVRLRPGETPTVHNGLPFVLRDGWIAATESPAEIGTVLPAGPGSVPALAPERPSSFERRFLAAAIPSFKSPEGPTAIRPVEERILSRLAIERRASLRDGGRLFAAWTAERDPFALPGAGDPGFTLTVLRKAIDP